MSAAVLAFVLFAQGVPMVTPLVGPPKVSWLGPPGDANGSGYDVSLEPLRLGLMDEAPLSGDPSCREPYAAAPTYYGTTLRLVPRLTLAGFSRVGCAMDGAVGGGLVYTVPIRKSIDLNLSAGAIFAPHTGPNGTPIAATHLRADLVFKRDEGRAWYIGLRKRGIAFGGVY
ncbi:MAG TPA: hypothetical protein VIF62_13390 [Labilithrix sp.]